MQAEEEVPGITCTPKGELAQLIANSLREVAAMLTVETGAATWFMADNTGIQQGDLEDNDNGVAIIAPAPKPKPPVTPVNEEIEVVAPVTVRSRPAASLALPSYSVGRGVSLPFGQSLPQCARCNCSALITMTHRSDPGKNRVLCLDHGLLWTSDTKDLVLLKAWN
jgi:hypothetical protein